MADMSWSISDDIHEFLAVAGPWLQAKPAENTILLSVAESLRAGASRAPDAPPIALGWWTDAAGTVSAAFLHTPPFPLVLTGTPPGAAALLAGRLADQGRALTQVTGDQRTVEGFAEEWLRRNPGATTAVAFHQRLYRLVDLIPPGTAGAARLAGVADRDLLIAWRTAFEHDAGLQHSDAARGVDNLLSYGGMTLWTVQGAPVSMASLTRPAAGMVRVGSVYTPPEHRRRGYAAAVVAEVSRAARAAGAAEVVLFTDLANPTSNSVYQRIGFRPIKDTVVLDLNAP
jgi:predicted GNAT family acetyltransferase